MKTIVEAYNEILRMLNKHKDLCLYDIDELERTAKKHLFGLELKEKYGFDLDSKRITSLDWISFSDSKKIGLFGKKYNRKISWSVDGRQPDDEYLFFLSYGTGAYIFGDDYPTDFFQTFWLELKSYGP